MGVVITPHPTAMSNINIIIIDFPCIVQLTARLNKPFYGCWNKIFIWFNRASSIKLGLCDMRMRNRKVDSILTWSSESGSSDHCAKTMNSFFLGFVVGKMVYLISEEPKEIFWTTGFEENRLLDCHGRVEKLRISLLRCLMTVFRLYSSFSKNSNFH